MRNVSKIIPLLLLLAGCCAPTHKPKSDNQIMLLAFSSRGGGMCINPPGQTLEIDSTLHVKYHGYSNVKDSGFYIGTIADSLWDTLNTYAVRAAAATDTVFRVSDGMVYHFILFFKNGKVLEKHDIFPSNQVFGIFSMYMMEYIKLLNLHKVDTVKFNTSIERPMFVPPPPPLIIKQLRVTPPDMVKGIKH